VIAMDKHQIAQHFARGAQAYDQVSPVQGAMGQHLLARVQHYLPAGRVRRIVELGSGTGRLTAALLAAYPHAELLAVDLAPAMIAAAQRRLGHSARVRWLVADAELLLADDGEWTSADLLISNATIQWFDQPLAVMARVHAALPSHAILAFSTFGPETFRELRLSFTAAAASLGLPAMPRTLKLPDEATWQAALATAPHLPIHCESALWPGTWPSLSDFLHQVRAAGANLPGGPPLTPTLWRAVQAHYHQHWAVAGGIQASYQPIWIYREPVR
jgi:malonyl-CoA O-methyltransferase